MKRRISTRVLSMFMALLMLLLMIPTSIFSASAEEVHEHQHVEADVWDGSVASNFEGGDGTEGNPYLIATASQLAYLASATNGGNNFKDVYFKLTNNIDLNGIKWTPIGNTSSGFQGCFDGNGKAIFNLYIDETNMQNVGFFAYISYGRVKSLAIINANVSAYYTSYFVSGGLLCGLSNGAIFEECFANGALSVINNRSGSGKSARAGLIVGHAEGNTYISDCFATGSSHGEHTPDFNAYVGGLAGFAKDLYIENSYFVGQVSSLGYDRAFSGGLVGTNGSSGDLTVNNSFATGQLSAEAPTMYTDAICGYWLKSIYASNCYFSDNLSSSYGTAVEEANFSDVLWVSETLGWNMDIWTVDPDSEYPYPTLKCFSGLYVPPTTDTPETPDEPDVPDEPDTPDLPNVEVEIDVWDGTASDGFGGGTGSESDPYLIYTGAQLAYFAQNVNAGVSYSGTYLKLMSDIDLANLAWTPIGFTTTTDYNDYSGGFAGNFDGNGKVISNLCVDIENVVFGGFFARINGGTVSSLAIVDADVNVYNSYAPAAGGILCGGAYNATISQCYVDGKLTVTNERDWGSRSANAGMLIGIISGEVNVNDCYATGKCLGITKLTWHVYAGGLVGCDLDGNALLTINSSYFNGEVIAQSVQDTYVAGLFGVRWGSSIAIKINNSFALGSAKGTCGSAYFVKIDAIACSQSQTPKISNCYYSMTLDKSGKQVESKYGTSTDKSNFTSSTWISETLGWNMDIWTVDPDSEYPYPTLKCFSGLYVPPTTDTPEVPDEPDIPDDPDTPDLPDVEIEIDVWDGTAADGFGGGVGSESDPYRIYTAEELAYLAETTNAGNNYSGVYFKLMNDIDLAGIPWEAIGIGEYTNDAYSTKYAFSGNFDGNHKTIYNLKVAYTIYSFTGLFGSLCNATISDLAIVDAEVKFEKSTSWRVTAGILAGASYNTIISGCYVTGKMDITISSANIIDIAALVGDYYNSKTLNSYAKADIRIYSMAGGFVGGLFGFTSDSFAENVLYIGNITESMGGRGSVTKGAICGDFDNFSATNAYYSGYSSSTFGTYVSDSALSLVSTFVGFDFEKVWKMKDGEPTLRGFGVEAPAEHIHEYIHSETIEPTCTTSGSSTAVCKGCGDKMVSYIPSKGHSYVSELTKEATCTQAGVITYTCVNCNDYYTINTHSSHNYELEVIPATCTEDGAMVYTCSKCGDVYENAITAGHNYEAQITKVATRDEDGEITYTCSVCNDSYTEVIPATDASVLLVQDVLPWKEDSATKLLDQLVKDGRISGWTTVTTNQFDLVDLSQYSVIYIANDQTNATYNRLANMNDALLSFTKAGGVVVYGASDRGWSSGHITYSLLGNVSKIQNYSEYNYIVDRYHSIVTGAMTDDKALTDALLCGNYCSHTSFDLNTLPEGYNVILQDGKGNPTLVEYPMGDGYVILSGLTWEYYYSRPVNSGTSYAINVFDDLIVYALSLSELEPCDHVYDEDSATVVEASCETEGYTLYICLNCGFKHKENYVAAYGHSFVNQNTDNEYLRNEANCEYAETYYYSCDCGARGEETFSYGAPLEHYYIQNPDDRYVCSQPTCDAYATYYESCYYCGVQGENTFMYDAPYGHNFVEIASDNYLVCEATCYESAIYEARCSRCGEFGYTFSYGNPAGHDFVEDASYEYICEDATCDEAATYYSHCSECGEYGDIFYFGSPNGHNYVQEPDWEYLNNEATCTESASYYEHCSECGEWSPYTFSYGEPLGHDHVEEESDLYLVSSATCNKLAVYDAHCSRCGVREYTFTAGYYLEHNFIESAEYKYLCDYATCTDCATYYSHCSMCDGYGYVFEYGSPIDHEYTQNHEAGYIYSEATCYEPAWYYETCAVCGIRGDGIFAFGEVVGHNYVENPDEKFLYSPATEYESARYYASCSYCGELGGWIFSYGGTLEHEHNFAEIPSPKYLCDEATCWTSATYYVSCKECGAKGDWTFTWGAPLEHNFVENPDKKYLVWEASCIDAALYYTSCSYCGCRDEFFSYGEPLGHDFCYSPREDGHYLFSKATCTESAKYHSFCKRCDAYGDIFEYGEPLGHDYREIISDEFIFEWATCTQSAVYGAYCSHCYDLGYTFNYGEPDEHNYSYDIADPRYIVSEATCTEPASYYCVCENCWERGDDIFYYGKPRSHKYDREIVDIATKVPGEEDLYYLTCECGELGKETFRWNESMGDPGENESTYPPTTLPSASEPSIVYPDKTDRFPSYTSTFPSFTTGSVIIIKPGIDDEIGKYTEPANTTTVPTDTATGTTAADTTGDRTTGGTETTATGTEGDSNITISLEGCTGSLGIAPIAILVVSLCGFAIVISRRKEN